YLSTLKAKLNDFEARKDEIDEIISDYEQLYDDATNKGLSDAEVFALLGDPNQVAFELIDSLKLKRHKNTRAKLIALSPFISLIVFFILGMVYDLWHPGWMVFLFIPIISIVLSTKTKETIIALSPFVTSITFILLGLYFDLWHPGWLIFLLIPIISIILNTKTKDVFVALSPFVALTAFIFLGMSNLWNPGWLVFLIIPMIGILYKSNKFHLVVYELTFLVAIAFYLYMGYVNAQWGWGSLGFLLPFVFGLIINDINFIWDIPKGKYHKRSMLVVATVLVTIVIFVVTGLLFNAWVYAWQVFLLIPMISIVVFDKVRFVALSPFIAVILFFSLGYFLDLWTVSWLAFLIIPITAIIENV
ncbi:MAG: DUF1700 domain-containing protein, partial [Acholeplasmataceae bacterium]|nr:DUF1700 domain-containing protein [Acholeplasmataceae bacterium]